MQSYTTLDRWEEVTQFHVETITVISLLHKNMFINHSFEKTMWGAVPPLPLPPAGRVSPGEEESDTSRLDILEY